MKSHFVVLIVASLMLAYVSLSTACTDEMWLEYKEKYDKSYNSTEDDMFHFYTFCDNLKALNERNGDFKLDKSNLKVHVSAVTDLTHEQQKEYYASRGIKRVKGQKQKHVSEEEEDY
ncbi:uncharacterized protein LOC129915916 [Episyrphus balteatus]|uniref:uncharacterized protein LOC129915916 n=1 Tax=Episyrphus balteatus TaxID=286459 RepID=UPI002485091B|nr:uncharacterized protein LOC129915916 [Episyrphus balteatus]